MDCILSHRPYPGGESPSGTAAGGVAWSLTEVGRRVVDLERWINMREGFTRKDDTLPARHFDEPMTVRKTTGHRIDRESFFQILDEYDCGMCVMVCPCDAIARDLELPVARKCDLCVGREAPGCVTIYPAEALMWMDTPESSCDGPSTSTSQLPTGRGTNGQHSSRDLGLGPHHPRNVRRGAKQERHPHQTGRIDGGRLRGTVHRRTPKSTSNKFVQPYRADIWKIPAAP